MVFPFCLFYRSSAVYLSHRIRLNMSNNKGKLKCSETVAVQPLPMYFFSYVTMAGDKTIIFVIMCSKENVCVSICQEDACVIFMVLFIKCASTAGSSLCISFLRSRREWLCTCASSKEPLRISYRIWVRCLSPLQDFTAAKQFCNLGVFPLGSLNYR